MNSSRSTSPGDVAFFTSCLDNDDSPDRAWRYFLAPITIFNDGHDQVHGWVLRRGSRTPERCAVVIDPFAHSALDDLIPQLSRLIQPRPLVPLCLSLVE